MKKGQRKHTFIDPLIMKKTGASSAVFQIFGQGKLEQYRNFIAFTEICY